MAKVKTNSDWSRLPHDLIGCITNRLTVFEDFVAFSSVCTSWRSSLLLHEQQRNCSKRCVPWLLLREFHTAGSSYEDRYYISVPTRFKSKKNKFNVKGQPLLTNAKRSWGSSIGWIFTLAHDNTTALVNPLTGVHITLPPLTKSIKRALVFVNGTDKNSNNNIIVMVISHYEDQCRLAFARPGFSDWITLHDHDNGGFVDVACYENKIIGVRANGALVTCETENVSYPRVTNFAPPTKFVNFHNVGRVYLIESAGDLLMVLMISDKFHMINESFKFYKFDFKTRRWVKLDGLGDRALFLGDNYPISVFPASGVDCIGNCIYFSTDEGIPRVSETKAKWPAMASDTSFSDKFNLYVSTDYQPNLLHRLNWRAVWVMPSLS